MDQIEQLPSQLSRRNWIVLAILLFASLPFGDLNLTAGILVGGLVAIGGFLWLRRSLRRLLEQPDVGGARFRYQFGYLIRLSVLAGILAILVTVVKVHAVGLIIGLSVVVVNLFWITAQRAFK
ncbi:MAG: ATP synthase subunit I [Desulfuromonadales bacterium]